MSRKLIRLARAGGHACHRRLPHGIPTWGGSSVLATKCRLYTSGVCQRRYKWGHEEHSCKHRGLSGGHLENCLSNQLDIGNHERRKGQYHRPEHLLKIQISVARQRERHIICCLECDRPEVRRWSKEPSPLKQYGLLDAVAQSVMASQPLRNCCNSARAFGFFHNASKNQR